MRADEFDRQAAECEKRRAQCEMQPAEFDMRRADFITQPAELNPELKVSLVQNWAMPWNRRLTLPAAL